MGKLTIFLEKRLEKKHNEVRKRCIEIINEISRWNSYYQFKYAKGPDSMTDKEFKNIINKILSLLMSFKIETETKEKLILEYTNQLDKPILFEWCPKGDGKMEITEDSSYKEKFRERELPKLKKKLMKLIKLEKELSKGKRQINEEYEACIRDLHSPDIKAQQKAVDKLEKLGNEDALIAIANNSLYNPPKVGGFVESILGFEDRFDAVKIIFQENIRVRAIFALARIRTEKAIKKLKEIVKYDHYVHYGTERWLICEAARAALQGMTQEELVENWQKKIAA